MSQQGAHQQHQVQQPQVQQHQVQQHQVQQHQVQQPVGDATNCGPAPACVWSAQGVVHCGGGAQDYYRNSRPSADRYVERGMYELDCSIKNTPPPAKVPLEWMQAE